MNLYSKIKFYFLLINFRIRIKRMENTVFVSVASYRDKICPTTVESIYQNAAHPEKIFVGICQQNEVGDVDCIEKGLENMPRYKHQVRVVRLKHHEARGPTYARFLCSTLFNGEEYYLQIDSHCKFIKNWDTLLIKMIKDLQASGIPNPVLSHYTPNYDDYSENPDPKSPVTTICKAWFTDQNLISLEGAGWVEPKNLPMPNAYIAAGMFFAESRFLQDIPFDPELDFLFIGEELLLSARFYTNGWDIFTPSRNTIFHLYTREKDPKFWDNKHIESDVASEKVRYLLGLVPNDKKLTNRQKHYLKIYGLGESRTLEEYFEFAGINVKDKKIVKNMCDTKSEPDEDVKKEEVIQVITTTTTTTSGWWIVFIIILLFVLVLFLILFISSIHSLMED